jgi:hypothetical protein
MEQEKQGNWSADHTVHKDKFVSKHASGNSSLIENEKILLEKIKLKQQKEIEQMMEYEFKMQAIRRENEEK